MCGDTLLAPAVSYTLFLEECSDCLGLWLECAFALNSCNFFSREIKLFLPYRCTWRNTSSLFLIGGTMPLNMNKTVAPFNCAVL